MYQRPSKSVFKSNVCSQACFMTCLVASVTIGIPFKFRQQKAIENLLSWPLCQISTSKSLFLSISTETKKVLTSFRSLNTSSINRTFIQAFNLWNVLDDILGDYQQSLAAVLLFPVTI